MTADTPLSPLDIPIDLWPQHVRESVPCGDCGRLMRPGDSEAPRSRRHNARGLCGVCYERHRRHGTLAQFTMPPAWGRSAKVPRAVVVAEVASGGWTGIGRRELPARLGMSRVAFERALYRARADGEAV